jgi:hypothetical protein
MRVADIPRDLLDHPHLTCTIQETARLLKCSVPKLRDMIKDGRIAARYVIEISASDRRINAAFFEVGNVSYFGHGLSDDDVDRV